ncbi:hypothetical protein AB4520_18555 [Vibrio renipiscarius]|uniref:hypothetical protein n=1 Tax=Vibrio renipiscarius TaxID=1461322 RepID=UPI00354EABE0
MKQNIILALVVINLSVTGLLVYDSQFADERAYQAFNINDLPELITENERERIFVGFVDYYNNGNKASLRPLLSPVGAQYLDSGEMDKALEEGRKGIPEIGGGHFRNSEFIEESNGIKVFRLSYDVVFPKENKKGVLNIVLEIYSSKYYIANFFVYSEDNA